MYQVGTWHVDWSEVGSGRPPRLLLVRVDCLQLNWTNDHEHGRIIATAINSLDGVAVQINEDEPYAAGVPLSTANRLNLHLHVLVAVILTFASRCGQSSSAPSSSLRVCQPHG